ncbi:hypothetical protein HZB60_09805 [candidate division KSB1 bacterium]|nr:hypothetical protein [candidate division KSB1 bacterium]
MRNLFRLLPALLLGLLVFAGCSSDDDNNNNPPATGTLTGSVIFHGEWPDSGAVQLSIFDNWNNEGTNCYWCATSAGGPPDYSTDAAYFQDPDPTNTSDADTIAFSLTGITLGTYETVVTGWRRPGGGANVECDEPVIGMYGANPGSSDTIPDAVTFNTDHLTHTIELHTWFNLRLPVAGCSDTGRVEGTVNLSGDWPAPGVAMIITSQPYSAWQPEGIAGYRGRYALETSDETFFSIPLIYGSYYISLWTNVQPPNHQYLGCYGVSATDAHPDQVALSASAPVVSIGELSAVMPPPHWISGTITFTGERPAEGIMVMLNPTFPPQGPPTKVFRITDANETLYAIPDVPAGAHYVSLWKNSSTEYVLYGAYFDPDGGDQDPDPVTISDVVYGLNGIDISGQP